MQKERFQYFCKIWR